MVKTVCIVQTNRGACDSFAELAADVLPDVRAVQVIDDGILTDINEQGGLTPSVIRRLLYCYRMAQEMGADAILHTCVVAADAVEMLKPFVDIPVVRIDEPVARQAVEAGDRVAVLATAKTAINPSATLIERAGADAGKAMRIERIHLAEAVNALASGNSDEYGRIVKEAITDASTRNDAVVLAQPSMATLLAFSDDAQSPVLVPGRSGFELLREIISK